MADTLPINFDIPSEPVLVNYDWTDFASKTGYINFYPAGYTDSTGDTYKLITTTSVGQPFTISITNAANFEKDFDFEFGVPQRVKGNAKITFTDYTQAANSNIYLKLDFYKVVGIVETSIGTVTGTTRTNLNGYMAENLNVNLTDTRFNIGEKLRVTILAVNSGANLAYAFYDPSGSTTYSELTTARTLTSQFKIQVPFVIQT